MLEDGTYDAIVFDVDERGDALVVELTLVAGPHKGQVVSLTVEGWTGDALELLATPATITVRDGRPSVDFD